MKSTTSKITALLALVAMFALLADTSDAGWRRRGSFGSSGSSGSWGSSGSSGSWGSSGSSGSRGYGRHHHHYSYSSGSSGSSGSSSWGSHGSSGHHSSGSYGSHGSSGSSSSSGSSGSHGYVVSPSHHAGYATTTTRSAPVVQSQPAEPVDNRARIQVNVPEDALVYLVGQQMTLTGSQRTYRLPQLPAGKTYNYPVKVEVVRDGETLQVEHTEQVTHGVTSSVVVVEQAGQLIVQKTEFSDRLVAEAR